MADKIATQPDDSPLRAETLDTLLDGKIQLQQSRNGYRFSLDAVLLARFVKPRRGESVMDLGAGNGVVGLLLAYLHPSIRVTAIEIQPRLADYARQNARLNGLADRVRIVTGDVRDFKAIAKPGSSERVVCNPPFRKRGSGRLSPGEERQVARHEIHGTLDDFLRAASYLLRSQGRMALIYPAVRGVDLLDSMRKASIEPKRLRVVHSYAGAEATLVLAEGVKGGRSGIEIMAPLVVYESARRYAEEVAAMFGTD